MKKSKRLLSLLLTAVMLLSVFAITSSADEGDATADKDITGVTIKTNTDMAIAGEVITVTVNVSTNYYATTMRWPVLFSDDFFELVEDTVVATDGLIAKGGSVGKLAINDSVTFTSTYTSDEYDSVLLQWQGVANGTVATYNVPEGMDCFTFQLKVKDDVEQGSLGQIVFGNENLFYKQKVLDPENITFDTIVQSKNMEFVLTTGTIECAVPEIIVVEDSDTVIDENTVIDDTHGIIRGVDVGVTDNLDAYVSTNGLGELVITPSQDNRMGTGTKVELVHGDKVLETYTVVIAGDVNGDALVDATDYILLDLAEIYDISLKGAAALAAEITDDGTVDVNDKIALDSSLIFAGYIDQVTGTYIGN